MIEVEVLGVQRVGDAVPLCEVRRLCILAAASAGAREGHLAIEFVDARRIAELNREHRGEPAVTDVLSFPVDGIEPTADSEPGTRGRSIEGARPPAGGQSQLPPRELGDVVICPEHTVDVREAIVHGVLHLVGMDHETDDGEMLALQRELLSRKSS